MSKVLSVHLLLFWGQATYDENQKITSKTSPIQLNHGSLEWENFMKHLKANGITKVTVQNVYDLSKKNGDKYDEVEDFSAIQEEVNSHLRTPEKELTPEQKRIKELEEKINAFTKSSEFSNVGKKSNDESQELVTPEIKQQLADFEALKLKVADDEKAKELESQNKIAEIEAKANENKKTVADVKAKANESKT